MTDSTTWEHSDRPDRSPARITIDDLTAVTVVSLGYDRSVDEREDALVAKALQCINNMDFNGALELLRLQQTLRSRYIDILDDPKVDVEDDSIRDMLPQLRAYATEMDNLGRRFLSIVEAIMSYLSGHHKEALRQIERAARFDSQLIEVNQYFASLVRGIAESYIGLMRCSATDYAGARAAYDRATLYYKELVGIVSATLEEQPTDSLEDADLRLMKDSANVAIGFSEARSFQMQYLQQMQGRDHLSAVDAARSASARFLQVRKLVQPISNVMASFFRASSHEMLAQAAIAQANSYREQREWDLAAGEIQHVREEYEAASLAVLASGHQAGMIAQERYLNAAFSWVTSFRRELDRDRMYEARIAHLERELDTFYAAVRGALAPAGVTVHTQNEAINMVQQQTTITARIESNLRNLLREASEALLDLDISQSERTHLSEEAGRLANDNGDPPTFFGRVKDFVAKLGPVLGTAVSVAGPLADLLKATSLIG